MVATPEARAKAFAMEYPLQDRLQGRRVLLEIGLDADLHEQVTAALEPIVRTMSADEVCAKYPAMLATYLVGHAVYHYNGNYWGSIDIRGIDGTWGPQFESAVKRLRLESFDDLVYRENAHRYLGRILAHSGMPRHCVGDLFGLIFQHLPDSHDAREMLTRWRSRSSTFANIDRPVKRFFLYGGPIAVDFLDRCIDLVRHEAQTGRLPTAETIGLPPYILTAYKNLDRKLERATLSGPRIVRSLPKPSITLDPWSGAGPQLTLPPIGAHEPGKWQVAGEQLDRFPTSRFDTQTVALEPADRWRVEIETGAERREWNFDASATGSTIAFDPSNGMLIDTAAGLRVDDAWLMTYRDVTVTGITSDDDSRELQPIEELPMPIGAWSSWRLQHLDLAGVSTLRASHGDNEHRISVRSAASRPYLRDAPIPGLATSDGLSVYDGLPTVVLPDGMNAALWSIRLAVNSDDAVNVPAVDIVNDREINIAALAPSASGRIHLTVRGPLGDTIRSEFAVVPGLALQRPSRLIWPDSATVVKWSTSHGSFDDMGQEITTPVDENHNQVSVTWHDNESALELIASVPKLLWGTVGASATTLSTAVHGHTVDELTAAEVQALAVYTGVATDNVTIELRNGASVLHTTAPRSIAATGRWVFSFAEFGDTLRLNAEPNLKLFLVIGGRAVEVLRLRATLDIRDLVAHTRVAGDFTAVDIEWDEPRPLKHRVLRLWSLTRPWQPPITESIPDDQVGHASVTRYDDLPPGRYVAELAIDDGWTALSERHGHGPATAPITIGDDADLIAYQDRLPIADPFNVLEIAATTGIIMRHLDEDELSAIAGAALVVLRSLYDDRKAQPRQLSAVQSLLVAHAPALVETLIEAAVASAWTSAELLRIHLGLTHRIDFQGRSEAIAEHSWAALWTAAPIVAAAMEFDGHATGDAHDRIEVACGWDPRTGVESIDPGQPVDQQFAMLNAEVLEQIIVLTQLRVDLPSAWFHIDSHVRANFQWLRADKRGLINAENAWRESQPLLKATPPAIPRFNGFQHSALAPKGTVAWAGLPAAIFSAACHIAADTNLRPDAERYLSRFIDHAPLIVTRDIMLALALARFGSEQ